MESAKEECRVPMLAVLDLGFSSGELAKVILKGIFSFRDLLIYSIIAMPLHSPKCLINITILFSLKLSHGKGPGNYGIKTFLPISSPIFPLPSVTTELFSIITCPEQPASLGAH